MTLIRFAGFPVAIALVALLLVAAPRGVSAQAVAFSGAIPTPGAAGLLVTGVTLSSDDLISELEFAGCTPEMVGLLTQGSWQVYIPGAPAAVNGSFPASLPASTPFFTRCSVDSPPALPRPTEAESTFVQMLLDTVFRQPTLDGLRPYLHDQLRDAPGIDVQLEYTSVLTGPLVGEYYLYGFDRQDVPLSGQTVSATAFAIVGDFEQGKALLTITIVPSGATFRVAGWASTLLAITSEDPGLGEVDFLDPIVGQCFDDDLKVIDCASPHDNEVFAVLTYSAGPDEAFPGDDPLWEFGAAGCVPAFEAYVGIDYDFSTYEITVVRPTEATWAAGDRVVACILYDINLAKITGSARGTAR